MRATGGILAIGVAFAGIGYFTFGIFAWLVLYWGTVGAAFGTAGICAVLASGVAVIALRHGPAPVIQNVQQPAAALGQSANLVSALRELSQDHPILAVCAAAILGAVGEGKR